MAHITTFARQIVGKCLPGLAYGAFAGVLLACGAMPAFTQGAVQPARALPPAALTVDQAWGGTGVSYDAVSIGSLVYIGYYDAERVLSVARVDTATGKVERKRLDSRFAGWDSHNSVTLELDRHGNLHVAGNMHTVPLVYARTLRPGDFSSLTQIDRMTGREESVVTYPRFFRLPDGDLAFAYRFGRSGDGVELINRFDGERWTRVTAQPLFASAAGGESVNAYPTEYLRGPDGRFHVAWVWRQTAHAETNFDVLYARSPDLQHWEDSRGRALPLPLTPANAEVAAPIAPRSGLMNNVRLGFDHRGVPIISYLRYDSPGNSQLYHARPGADGWQRAAATDWNYRWSFSGTGTLVGEIGFSGVRYERGVLVEDVTHREFGRLRIELDPVTLAGTARPASAPASAPAAAGAAIQAPFRPSVRSVRTTAPDAVRGSIRWQTLGSANNDQPRTCASVKLPPDCRMSAPLELQLLPGQPPLPNSNASSQSTR